MLGYFFWGGPHHQDYRISGSLWCSLIVGNYHRMCTGKANRLEHETRMLIFFSFSLDVEGQQVETVAGMELGWLFFLLVFVVSGCADIPAFRPEL